MWLMRWIMFADPGVSTASIGRALGCLRLGMLATLLAALAVGGASLLTLVGVAVTTAGVLRNLRIYQYHYVPFVLMLPLFLIAAYLLLLETRRWTRGSIAVTFAAVGGNTILSLC
jgi:hypothetical protein